VADVPARFEALGMLGGVSRPAVRAQLRAGLRVVLQVRRAAYVRYLEEVGVLRPYGDAVHAEVAWHHLRGPGPAAVDLAALLAGRGVAVPTVLGGLP
jgi:pilus assembly protein CpaF